MWQCGMSLIRCKFNAVRSGSGFVDISGEQRVSAAPLDIALRNRKADFIKMDIEGAETNALVGAYQVVLRNKPTLAVSAYHQPGHLFQVPLLIKAMAPDYKLHLRHYREYAVSETVCCGISKKR